MPVFENCFTKPVENNNPRSMQLWCKVSSLDFKHKCRDDYLAQAKNKPSEFWDFTNFTSNCSRGRLASDSTAVLICLC